jgi:hypothetical protein
MITIDGISGAWNYTIGQILIWEGVKSLDRINTSSMPVVVVAKYIDLPQLGKVDFNRVLGFVLEEGGPGDPAMIVYSNQHRATVLQAKGALAKAKEGEIVVIDGVAGKVFFEPDEETLKKYEILRKQGPPPEPPGMVQKLMKVATDFGSFDPSALKGSIIDFDGLGKVMSSVMTMWRGEKLDRREAEDIRKFAKGTPVEESIEANIGRYEKVQAELAAKQEEEARKAEPIAPALPERGGRRVRGADGRVSELTPTGGEAAGASSATATAEPPADVAGAPAAAGEAAPADSAAARRAAREAEIEAARKARRGGDNRPQ